MEEIQPNEITPPPAREMTTEEHDTIVTLLQSGLYPREIFISYNFPLEWALKVEEELKPIEPVLETPTE